MDLARGPVDRMPATVVGITGSVGKTSTKDLVAAAVGAGRRVTANERSFNNEQGLPVTVLGAPDDTEVLVLEMGMRGFGEIARLCAVGRPDIGVVTTVAAVAHRAGRRHRGRRPGQRRARRRAALRRHGHAQRRRRAGGGDGGAPRPACHVRRAATRRAGRGWRSTSSPGPGSGRDPWGVARSPWPSAARTWPRTRPPRSPSPASSASTSTRRRRARPAPRCRRCGWRCVAAAAGGVVVNDAYNANPSSMAAALGVGRDGRRPPRRGPRPDGRARRPRRRPPRGRRAARRSRHRAVAVGTDRYGVAPIDRCRSARRRTGRRRGRGPRQGEPGRRARTARRRSPADERRPADGRCRTVAAGRKSSAAAGAGRTTRPGTTATTAPNRAPSARRWRRSPARTSGCRSGSCRRTT